MKRIILDHLRRWGLVWIAIGIANYFISGSFFDTHEGINIKFAMLLWLGALELNSDLQRGSGRVVAALPVSARQIGQACWIFSVALPTLFLAATSGLAMFVHSIGTTTRFPMNDFVVASITYALYFGSFFYLFIGSTPGRPQNALAWLWITLTSGLVFGMLFVKPSFDTPQGIIVLLAAAALTVTGWFRAGQMFLQRASFKLVPVSSKNQKARHETPQGFGGLPYLIQKNFIQSTLFGLAMMASMALFMSFLSRGQDPTHAIISMIQGGSSPYVFLILMSSIVPVVFQLRFLRTLPVSPSLLAATLVSLPVFSIATVGLIVTVIARTLLGEMICLPFANSFLILGAQAAVVVPLIAWRGLDVLTYLLIILLMIFGSHISLAMPPIFHLGTKGAQENPWWSGLIVLLGSMAAALVLTQMLLVKNSSAYRVRTMPANAWRMARR